MGSYVRAVLGRERNLVPVFLRTFFARFSKMEADLYDEFGNYIGPELESDEESEEEEEADEEDAIEYVSEWF